MGKVCFSFDEFDAHQNRQEEMHPCCCECGEKIFEHLFDIGGELFCVDCMLEHKKPVERYLGRSE